MTYHPTSMTIVSTDDSTDHRKDANFFVFIRPGENPYSVLHVLEKQHIVGGIVSARLYSMNLNGGGHGDCLVGVGDFNGDPQPQGAAHQLAEHLRMVLPTVVGEVYLRQPPINTPLAV